MPTCQICLRSFQRPRYKSARITICGHCVNDLNTYRQTADAAYRQFHEWLKAGKIRRATIDVTSGNQPDWVIRKAEQILSNPDAEVEKSLPKWMNKLLADCDKTEQPYKIARAYRRGLLHFDKPHNWGYPKNWELRSRRIKALDGATCVSCGTKNVELHTHHIVYLSNYGTHRKENLITLCKACHEKEHERSLDFGESSPCPEETLRPPQPAAEQAVPTASATPEANSGASTIAVSDHIVQCQKPAAPLVAAVVSHVALQKTSPVNKTTKSRPERRWRIAFSVLVIIGLAWIYGMTKAHSSPAANGWNDGMDSGGGEFLLPLYLLGLSTATAWKICIGKDSEVKWITIPLWGIAWLFMWAMVLQILALISLPFLSVYQFLVK